MQVTPVQLTIALGRKLEALHAQDRALELSEESLANDRELELLLQFSLTIGNHIQKMGYEPLDPQSLTEADIETFKQAMARYLPQ